MVLARQIIIPLIFMLLSSCASQTTQQSPMEKSAHMLQQVLELTRLTREDPSQQTEQEAKTTLKQLIPDYTHSVTIEGNIRELLHRSLNLDVSTEQILPLNGNSHLSANPVYRVINSQGSTILAIKVYASPWNRSSSIIRELSALDLTSLLLWRWMTPIHAKAIGQCQIGEKSYAMVVLSYARGDNLQDLVAKMRAQKDGSLERYQSLQSTKNSFETFGQALAELHRKQVGKPHVGTIRPYLKRILQIQFDDALDSIELSRLDLDRQALQRSFAERMTRLEQEKIPYRYSHGEAQLHNFYYDSTSETITMTNLASLHDSIGSRGQPIGIAALDYLQVEHDLKRHLSMGLNEDEVVTLILGFQMGYFKGGGIAPTAGQRRFGDLLIPLRFLGAQASAIDKLPEELAAPMQAQMSHDLQEVKEIIKQANSPAPQEASES